MRIRTGRGLGDTIYLRPIVEHFISKGHQVTALVDYPQIFRGTGAKTEPFRRNMVEVVAHYVNGKSNPVTTQWHDMCVAAGIKHDLPLNFKWGIRNTELATRITQCAGDRPIVIVHGGRAPYGRTDGFGLELIPARHAFAEVLRSLDDCYRVLIGKDGQVYDLRNLVDVDLSGSTSIYDLLDLGVLCKGVVAQCSFAVPLAEVFDKPLLGVWATIGLESVDPYIRATTPRKILSKPTSLHVMDGWNTDMVEEGARAFRRLF